MWRLFGMRTSIGDFVWTRAPFGWSHSPYNAHLLADALCDYLRSLGMEVDHFSDDFQVYADDPATCLRHLERCICFCESVGVRIKARKTVFPTTVLPICGVMYNLFNKRSFLLPSYWTPCKAVLKRWSANAAARKYELASFIGKLCFANHAYVGSLCVLNPLLNFLAEHSNADWHDFVDTAPILRVAARLLDWFVTLTPCALQAPGEDVRVFADARPGQIGAIVDNQAYARSIDLSHVFVAEAKGAAFALALSDHLPSRLLVLDNLPLVYALTKGRSSDAYTNSVIFSVLNRRLSGQVINFEWIPTEDNPADFPSRVDLSSDERSNVIVC
jgi:hypothetical protein